MPGSRGLYSYLKRFGDQASILKGFGWQMLLVFGSIRAIWLPFNRMCERHQDSKPILAPAAASQNRLPLYILPVYRCLSHPKLPDAPSHDRQYLS